MAGSHGLVQTLLQLHSYGSDLQLVITAPEYACTAALDALAHGCPAAELAGCRHISALVDRHRFSDAARHHLRIEKLRLRLFTDPCAVRLSAALPTTPSRLARPCTRIAGRRAPTALHG